MDFLGLYSQMLGVRGAAFRIGLARTKVGIIAVVISSVLLIYLGCSYRTTISTLPFFSVPAFVVALWVRIRKNAEECYDVAEEYERLYCFLEEAQYWRVPFWEFRGEYNIAVDIGQRCSEYIHRSRERKTSSSDLEGELAYFRKEMEAIAARLRDLRTSMSAASGPQ